MKKAWTTVLVLGLIATVVAIGAEVTSVNAVGFTKIDIEPGKLVLVSPVFESFTDQTVAGIVGDQLPTGSKAYIFDRATGDYLTSTKQKGTTGWDGPGTNMLFRGDALWLKNAGLATESVSMMGEVPYDYNGGKTSTVYGILGVDAVGYAFPTDVVWTNTTLSAAMGSGDRVYIFNEGTGGFDSYPKAKGTAPWSSAPAGLTIEAGRAFFVKTANSIDWTEVAPYNLD